MKFSHVTKEKENRTQHASTPVYTVYTVYTGAQQVHQDTYAPAPREVAPLQQPRRQQKGNEMCTERARTLTGCRAPIPNRCYLGTKTGFKSLRYLAENASADMQGCGRTSPSQVDG